MYITIYIKLNLNNILYVLPIAKLPFTIALFIPKEFDCTVLSENMVFSKLHILQLNVNTDVYPLRHSFWNTISKKEQSH